MKDLLKAAVWLILIAFVAVATSCIGYAFSWIFLGPEQMNSTDMIARGGAVVAAMLAVDRIWPEVKKWFKW